MSSRKKQSVAAAMATAIGVSALISPVAIHAQEKVPPTAITQETAINSTQKMRTVYRRRKKSDSALLIDTKYKNVIDTIRSSIEKNADDAFTDQLGARKAIEDALNSYDFSNETTQQEIQDFLNQQFVDTGKLKEILIWNYSVSTNATTTDKGKGEFYFNFTFMNGSISSSNQFELFIPRLPKEGEVAINSKNFPDPIFKKYVKDNFDTVSDGVLSADEIGKITGINVGHRTDIKNLMGIEHFTSLKVLYCNNTGISSLDVSNNKALTELHCQKNANLKELTVKGATALTLLMCHETGILDLDVSSNKALTELVCSSTGITSLNVSDNEALTNLDCDSTGIEKLDVSSNKALKKLDCYSTGIQDLDVSNNKALINLGCSSTGIQDLDVSSNPDLKYLYCYSTGITSLNVSNNKVLEWLYCYNTGITSLDVSNNEYLTYLICSDTPLAYLNLGTDRRYTELEMSDLQLVDIEVPVDTFKVTDIFPGIKTKNITNIKGANYDDTNGIMSNYTLGKNITYTYDCGNANGYRTTIDVSLHPMGKSTISIIDVLDKTYDGKAVSANPVVNKTGSSGAVSYKWERKKNANDWEDIASAPKDVGTYRVKAIVASDNEYKGATSNAIKFTISQATNSWTDRLSITGWTYGATANEPTAKATFGKVSYLYSDSKNGTYTDAVPGNAGIWYVKAVVVGTENYTGMETILDFTIAPKSIDNNSSIIISDIKSDKDVESLVVKDGDKELVQGTDYEVEKKQKGNNVEVVITFKGNYTGTITKSYTVNSVSAGDTTHTGLLAMITLLSASCIVFLTGKKRRKEF